MSEINERMDLARGLNGGLEEIPLFAESLVVATAVVGVGPVAIGVNWLAAASALKISSSDAKDDAAGVGAKTMRIDGLDASHAEITETVTMDGQTQVTSTLSFLRINALTVLTVGTELDNAGIIYVYTGTATAGVPDDLTKIYEAVGAGHNRESLGQYTMPAGKTGILDDIRFSGYNTGAGESARAWVKRREFGSVFRTQVAADLADVGTNSSPKLPVYLPAKCDIAVEAIGTAGTSSVRFTAHVVKAK